jgi:hypothetical protein
MKKLTLIFISLPLFSAGQVFDPVNATICKGGDTSFKSGTIYPAPTYQWQIRHKGIWYDITNTAPFSGATSRELKLSNVSDTLDTDSFKCKVYFNSNLVGTSKAAMLTVTGTSSSPTSASASVNPVDCPGGATQLSVTGTLSSGSSWKWYAGYCGKNAVNSSVKPDSTTTYYVRAEGSCRDTSSCVTVTVVVTNNMSIAPSSVVASPDTICSGHSTTLSMVGGVLGTGAIWKWYSDGNCSTLLDSEGVSSILVSPASTTTYSVKADGKCGSTVCKTITVMVNPLPVMDAGIDTALCMGSSVGLNPSVTGTNTYLWNPATGLDNATLLRPKANPTATTIYKLTVKDANNCVKTDSVKVQVNSLPNAIAGNDTSICEGGMARLYVQGGTAYSWTPVDGLNYPNSSNPMASPSGTTKYKVTVTDQNLCSDTTEVQIIVNPIPKINITNDTAICDGNSVVLHSEGGTTYDWSPKAGLDFPNSSKPRATPAADISYKVLVTNADGCSGTDSVLITVNPYPTANASSDVTICKGDTVQLSTTDGTGYGYSWTPAVSIQNANTRTPMVSPDAVTTYHVEVSLNGCNTQDSVKVTVVNKPTPIFTAVDSVVCKNASLAEYCITPSSNAFQWTVDYGTIMAGQGTNCIYVHWSGTAPSGSVSVKESLNTIPACPVNATFNVVISGGPAPFPAKVAVKDNNISTRVLLCEFCIFNFYEWGFESKSNKIEQNTCTGTTFCSFSGGIDTVNFYYWVKVGNDKACLTKSYFNQPRSVTGIALHESFSWIILYPNPVKNQLTIESRSAIESIEIINAVGQSVQVLQTVENHNQWTLDLINLPNGMYFIGIKTNDGFTIRKIAKQ